MAKLRTRQGLVALCRVKPGRPPMLSGHRRAAQEVQPQQGRIARGRLGPGRQWLQVGHRLPV